MLQVLASVVLGLVKGLTDETEGGFSIEKDVWGPTKEELVYRAAPLWAFPRMPYGTTAVLFAVDHVLDDIKADGATLTASDLVARFGDVLLGGLMYESAYRRQGLVAAVAAHAAHNVSVGLGARLRRRK